MGFGADLGKRPKSSLNLLVPFTGNKHRFQMDFNNWNLFWSLCFGLLSFLIIVGNALSISILFKRRLRKRPHFLLISLAFADLLVGLIPVPLYIMIQLQLQANLLLHTTFLVHTCMDIFAGLSSFFTLAAISLERLHAFAVSFSVITSLQFFSGIIISLSTSLLVMWFPIA